MILSVYCSGSIMKGVSDQKKLCWTDTEKSQVETGAQPLQVVFLNPDDPITDPENTIGQFGRDMFQVMIATAIIVDARERRGLGIGVEMAAAATFGTPVIVVAPRNSLYRTEHLEYRGTTINNYVHPHVASLAFSIVDDFEQAGKVLATLTEPKVSQDAVPAWLMRAVSEYRNNVFYGDEPMLRAVEALKLAI